MKVEYLSTDRGVFVVVDDGRKLKAKMSLAIFLQKYEKLAAIYLQHQRPPQLRGDQRGGFCHV
jgi:hypothetical protein